MRILVVVPSRGRPARAEAMLASLRETARLPETAAQFVVDRDDPELAGYVERGLDPLVVDRIGYTGSLNLVARSTWDAVDVLGAFGDDVLFRTAGWDERVAEALATPGIAYGNDLVHAAGHPTAVWMSSAIAKALGWLALPASWHLWVDDAWKRLGQESGTLRYLPDVVVEHMHPAVGKAEDDATYRSVYDGERAHRDHLGFLEWERSELAADAEKVRRVAGVPRLSSRLRRRRGPDPSTRARTRR